MPLNCIECAREIKEKLTVCIQHGKKTVIDRFFGFSGVFSFSNATCFYLTYVHV